MILASTCADGGHVRPRFGGVTITIESDPAGNLWVAEAAAGRLARIDR
jgi:hypothetical protein